MHEKIYQEMGKIYDELERIERGNHE